MGRRIFVSYRRSDSHADAMAIGADLANTFGSRNVFTDINLTAGQDFPTVLEQRLAESRVLLVLIGPNWDARDDAGTRRLDDPEDWVHREIARAIALKIAIIPVCINGTALPARAQLPEDIRVLADKHAAFVTRSNFRNDMDGLARTLRDLGIRRSRPLTPAIAVAVVAALAIGGAAIAWWLQPQPSPPSTAEESIPQDNPLVRMAGSIAFQSDPGDYIGDGKPWKMSDADGLIQSRVRGNSVEIFYDGDESWSLTFAAPMDATLEAGDYGEASRASMGSPVKPGLDVSGAARGCNELTGAFKIREIAFDESGTKLTRLQADFEQHCDKGAPALRGTVDLSVRAQ